MAERIEVATAGTARGRQGHRPTRRRRRWWCTLATRIGPAALRAETQEHLGWRAVRRADDGIEEREVGRELDLFLRATSRLAGSERRARRAAELLVVPGEGGGRRRAARLERKLDGEAAVLERVLGQRRAIELAAKVLEVAAEPLLDTRRRSALLEQPKERLRRVLRKLLPQERGVGLEDAPRIRELLLGPADERPQLEELEGLQLDRFVRAPHPGRLEQRGEARVDPAKQRGLKAAHGSSWMPGLVGWGGRGTLPERPPWLLSGDFGRLCRARAQQEQSGTERGSILLFRPVGHGTFQEPDG
jgi:hypothetical protein